MIRHDRFLHMVVSFVLAVAGSLFVGRWGGIAFAFLIGAAKELWDWRTGRGTPEWGDMAANVVGLVLAWALLMKAGL